MMEYHFVGAIVVIIIGMAILMKGGSKWGLLFVIGGGVWIYLTLKKMGLV